MAKMKELMIEVSEVLMTEKYSYSEIADMFGISVEEVDNIDGGVRIMEAEYNGGF